MVKLGSIVSRLLQQARDKALEEAAQTADAAAEAARPYANGIGMGPHAERHRMKEAQSIAAAIRALKTPVAKEGERP